MIELPYVPNGGSAEQLLSLARADGFLTGRCESDQTPYIPNLGEGSLELRDGHFRRDLQRRMRKARARGPVLLKRLTTADSTALRSFYELESSGWKGKNNTSIASSAATRRFYDEIASAGARHGYLSLYLLHVGDTVAAGHFGLAYNGRYYSVKVAYNEDYADCGPGHLIVQAILGDLVEREFEEYDFLGPWMEWKAKWAGQVRGHAFCYVFRPGLYGTMLHAAKLKLIRRLRSISRHPSIAYVRSRLHT
ncbi:MAG TPA: GNAT family N-acetyltransferase [Bryobacteraceae bacterium]|nr:GNAT family N-acetyltransferase [Bryobacteraceae bacterium]